jgi:hypothetical protein
MSQAAAKRHTFPKTIEIEITDEENTLRMKQHLDVEFKIDAVKAERAATVSEFTQQLKDLRKQRGELITTIQSKKEKRDIECYQEPDYRRHCMVIKRADTDQVIDERALTAEELQESLPGTKDSKGGKKPEAAAAPAAAGDGGIVDNNYKPDGHVEGAAQGKGGGEPATTNKGGAGKVTRIKASDAKKTKAKREAKAAADKARAIADQNDADNEGA